MKKKQLAGAGLLFILISAFLGGYDSPLTGIALVAGMILLSLGCFLWAFKLPWYVSLTIGGVVFAAACFAGVYVPLIVRQKHVGDETPGFLIYLINFTLGVPGAVLISAGVASLLSSSKKRSK